MDQAPILETGDLPEQEVERLLTERLLPLRWPGEGLSDLKLDRVRFTPGKECTVSGSFQLSGAWAENSRQRFVLGYIRAKTLRKMRNHQARDSLQSNPSILDPDTGFLIEVFPEG